MNDISCAKKGDIVKFVYIKGKTYSGGSFTVGKIYTVSKNHKEGNSIFVKEDDNGNHTNGHQSKFFEIVGIVKPLTLDNIIGEM